MLKIVGTVILPTHKMHFGCAANIFLYPRWNLQPVPHARDSKTILTLNSLSRIKLRLGQAEELVCSRMKYSRLYVILLHLVLSAKSVYNF